MKRMIRMNPILRKELMVGSRSIKMSLAIMGVNALLTFIVLLVIAVTSLESAYGGYDYSGLGTLFPVLSCIECGMLSLIVPIITSGSISGERERQTLDIMLTTPVSPFAIALGKLEAAMMVVMMYIISSVPVMAISFVLGGMSWWALIGLFVMLLSIGIYVGSVGVFCSSLVKKSILATILTIVIGLSILFLTSVFLSTGISIITYRDITQQNYQYHLGAVPMIMFLNPYSGFVDYLVRVLTNTDLCTVIEEVGTKDLPTAFAWIYKAWVPISILVNLLVSIGFLKLASLKIAVIRNKK